MATALKEPDVLILAFSLCCIENEVGSFQEVSFRVLMCICHPKSYASFRAQLKCNLNGGSEFV